MRMMTTFLPMILLTLSLPAMAQQPQPASPKTRVYRSGTGAPRVRDAAGRTYSPSTLKAAESTARSSPYKVPKPGEGASKGS